MTESMEELIKTHDGFIRRMIRERGELTPQIVVCKGKDMNVFVLADGRRETIKVTLEMAKAMQPDHIVCMYEGYMRDVGKVTTEKEKERIKTLTSVFKHGDLERDFEMGDERVKEVVILLIYKGDERRLITYEKVGRELKRLPEPERFEGYFT